MSGYATNIYLIFALFFLLLPYLYIMMRVHRGLMFIRPEEPVAVTSLKVSVIIATNREPSGLKEILRDLSVQKYNHDDYEVIVTDDSSGKWSSELEAVVSLYPRFKLISNRGSGKKSAIKTAIIAAGGELIITTDDDCRVSPGWILSIASFYRKTRYDMIICPVELTGKDSFFTRVQQLEFSSLQGVTAGSASLGDALMCNGAGLAFKREIYPNNTDSLVPDVPSGDDTFFLLWLKKRGAAIGWLESQEAVVKTEAAVNLRDFFKQRSRWASKALYYNDFSTIATGVSVVVASALIAALMIGCIFNPAIMPYLLIALLLKSVPDIMIVMNRLQFQNRTDLLVFFPLVQLFYPLYSMLSLALGLFSGKRW